MSKNATNSLFGPEIAESEPCTHTIRVAFESAVDNTYDYSVPDRLWPVQVGQRVEVKFGRSNKITTGYCVGCDCPITKAGIVLKSILGVVDEEVLLDSQLMSLAMWISSYYVCPLGQVLAAMLPAAVKKGAGVGTAKYIYLARPEQFEADLKSISKSSKQKEILSGLFAAGAMDAASAIEAQEVLGRFGTTAATLKHLLQKELIKIDKRQRFKSLPAIPEAMADEPKEVVLNDEQVAALESIRKSIDAGTFEVTLLHGVTDSGKTEVYIKAIEAVIAKGKSAIILLPEIALTAQTVQRFNARFERIAIMHSGLSGPQRNAQWQKIKAGQADVVIGARSALFAPLPNLGLIVVDEEHESGYKQDTAPRYHARDAAIKRCQLESAHCILGSATPSLESLTNCENRKHFNLVKLTKRVMNLPMPEMQVVDMKSVESEHSGPVLVSPQLRKELAAVLGRGEQAILLLNRRGYSNFVYCPGCKHTLQCRNCDVTLTFHKRKLAKRSGGLVTASGKHLDYGYAMCHYCMSQTLVPEKCPLCNKKMVMFGLGSQRLEEEVGRMFPDAPIARIDSDSMQSQDYYNMLRDFAAGKISILAGTQMLAKGLHFPNVTLVGIISADTSLYVPDFRANERTFQIISQVAGRAGRSEKKGKVFIQTFMPEQPAIMFATQYDFAGFIEEELKCRKACNLPPYWRMALMVLKDEKFDRLTAACNAMNDKIMAIVAGESLNITVRGPMPCTINRIERHHRMQFIFESPTAAAMQKLFAILRSAAPIKPYVKISIDIDPVNLL